MRAAIMRKRDKNARVIQQAYRRRATMHASFSRGVMIRLAVAVQRAWRGYKNLAVVARLRRTAAERAAARLINRAYRGYRGRQRLTLKREFMHSIAAAMESINLNILKPGDIEVLFFLFFLLFPFFLFFLFFNLLSLSFFLSLGAG